MVVAVCWVEGRTGVPGTALFTLVGLAYALAPGPDVVLDPDVVLTVVLPSLLYAAALDALGVGLGAVAPLVEGTLAR